MPFLLLPFRPASDPSASRTFIRNYFGASANSSNPPRGEALAQELRLTEPMVSYGTRIAEETCADTAAGSVQRAEMVLESTPWRSGDLGSVRVV